LPGGHDTHLTLPQRERPSFFSGPSPFIDRDAELAWLERLLQQAVEGRPHVAFVSGEAGVGKTRLLRELRNEAARAGVRVVYGRCREELDLPYAPLEPLFRELVREDAASVGDTRDALASSHDGGRRRAQFQSIAERVFQHARGWAILLVLEDLHWADRASLELLAHLCFAADDAAQGEAVPLLVVCTLRRTAVGDALAQVRARLAREEIFHEIDLEGLGLDEVEALTRALGISDPSRHLVARLLQVTDGNVLFLEEILRNLVREGALERRGERWLPTVDPAEVELPGHVALAIHSNIESFDEQTLEILAAAVPLDAHFDGESLAAITGAPRQAVDAAVRQALDLGLLRAQRNELRFRHSLLRQGLQSRLGPARRAALHRRIAEWLEARHAGDTDGRVGEIAHHWLQADHRGEEARVMAIVRRAGDRALEELAHDQAARWYQAALSLDEKAHLLSARERGELHRLASLAHFREMDADLCLAECEKAARIYREVGDWEGLARSLALKARTEVTLAPAPVGTLVDLAPLEECLAHLPEGAAELRCEIDGVRSEAYNFARHPERAEEIARGCLVRARELGNARLCAWVGLALGSAQLNRLAVAEALATYDDALADARRSGDTWTLGLPLHRIPLVLASLGRLAHADRYLLEADAVARRTGDWGDHSIALGANAAIALARGDLWGAEDVARDTIQAVRRTGYPWGGVTALMALASARALRGAWQEAEDAVALLEAPGLLFAEPGPDMQFMAAQMRLRLRTLAGRPGPGAAAEAENFLKILEASGLDLGTLSGFCICLEVAASLGHSELARRAADTIGRAVGDEMLFSHGCEFLIPRVLGVGAACRGAWDEAEEQFARALSAARETGAASELARTQVDLAAALLGRGAEGDREEAGQRLTQAQGAISRLGLHGLEGRAAELARSLDRPDALGGDASGDTAAIEEGERRLLECVARGRNDAEIGDRLLIRADTTERRLRALFDKLGVAGRTEATAWAIEQGIGMPARRAEPGGGPRRSRAHLPHAGLRAGEPVAILVSDIQRSTEIIQTLGDAKARELVHVHNRIARACLREQAGSEVQHTGDGFIFTFASAVNAVRCAVAFQRALERHRRDAGESIRVRIGVHTGTPIPEEGRLFGLAMNTAARICSHCPTGEIEISQPVREACADLELGFEARGPAQLKGIEQPVPVHRVLWQEKR
jgi:class 3 adenylate cyclase/tetratricopeptide (TPR) repeat protein